MSKWCPQNFDLFLPPPPSLNMSALSWPPIVCVCPLLTDLPLFIGKVNSNSKKVSKDSHSNIPLANQFLIQEQLSGINSWMVELLQKRSELVWLTPPPRLLLCFFLATPLQSEHHICLLPKQNDTTMNQTYGKDYFFPLAKLEFSPGVLIWGPWDDPFHIGS